MEIIQLLFLVGFALLALIVAAAMLFGRFSNRLLGGDGRRSRGTAALLGIGALGLLAYAALWVYPGLDHVAGLRALNQDLRTQLALSRAESQSLTAAKTTLMAQTVELNRDFAAASDARDRVIALGTARLAALGAQARRIRGEAAIETRVVDFVPAGATFERGRSLIEQEFVIAETELHGLRDYCNRPAVQAAGPQETKGLMEMRDRMSQRLSTPSYNVETYPDNQLIKGRAGRYYVIDLKDANAGVRYTFDKGKYTLSRKSTEFRSSLNAFTADILKKLHNKVDYAIFVRGSADSIPFRGRQEPDYEYQSIRYLKSAGAEKYATDYSERAVTATISNEDLPALRAAFLQQVIAEAYPVRPPIVLEGQVTRIVSDADRNAELILYVDW